MNESRNSQSGQLRNHPLLQPSQRFFSARSGPFTVVGLGKKQFNPSLPALGQPSGVVEQSRAGR